MIAIVFILLAFKLTDRNIYYVQAVAVIHFMSVVSHLIKFSETMYTAFFRQVSPLIGFYLLDSMF